MFYFHANDSGVNPQHISIHALDIFNVPKYK